MLYTCIDPLSPGVSLKRRKNVTWFPSVFLKSQNNQLWVPRVHCRSHCFFLPPNPACLLQWTRNVYSRDTKFIKLYVDNNQSKYIYCDPLNIIMLINCVKYVNLFMQTVKMNQLERNLGQLCDRNRKRYGGSPCLQIQLAYTMHLSDIVVVSFTHLKRYDYISYIQILFNPFIEDYMWYEVFLTVVKQDMIDRNYRVGTRI